MDLGHAAAARSAGRTRGADARITEAVSYTHLDVYKRQALTLAWIAGCAKLVFPGDLSLGAVFAAAAVCRALDGTNYLLTAAACGLTLDVCREPLLSATFLYTASALAAHAAPLRTRIGRALLFALSLIHI